MAANTVSFTGYCIVCILQHHSPRKYALNLNTACGNQPSSSTNQTSCAARQLEMDNTTIGIIIFFLISSCYGHILLHRVIKTPAQYQRPKVDMKET